VIVVILYKENTKQWVLQDLPCDEDSHVMMVWVRVVSMVQPHLPLAEAI
jgi:hypothetical protein